jgi:hypothetical protein
MGLDENPAPFVNPFPLKNLLYLRAIVDYGFIPNPF